MKNGIENFRLSKPRKIKTLRKKRIKYKDDLNSIMCILPSTGRSSIYFNL